jgi:hypothetical protein
VTVAELGETEPLYQQVTITSLPDDALLEVFDFYMNVTRGEDRWHTLVHVCRRWRIVVFASPHRLNLQLLCTQKRPVKKMLGIWPALPIIVSRHGRPTSRLTGAHNIIAALEYHERVCKISLESIPSPLVGRLAEVMHEPFLALTSLVLSSKDGSTPVLPESFMGGSAPRLQTLWLESIPFPAARKLHLTASDLVDLRLLDVPHSGYISPDAMVTCLSSLTGLETLELGFRSPRSRPYNLNPPPLTRAVLPSLTKFWFKGVSEYLEDLVAQIDAPLLNSIIIIFFHQLIFRILQLLQFVSRIDRFKVLTEANVFFDDDTVRVTLSLPTTEPPTWLALVISCREPDWQISSLAQVCSLSLPPLPTLQRLELGEFRDWRPHWPEDMENSQWLELLHPFTAVRDLYLSHKLAPRIAPALQELSGERTKEVLPALQNIFLQGPNIAGHVQEAIGQFAAARRHSGHTMAVHRKKGRKWVANAL